MTRGEPFSDVLYAMPVLWGRLLAEHVPDETGRRCRACTTAGTGSPGAAWPCSIRGVAELARDRFAQTRSRDRAHPRPVAEGGDEAR